MRGDSYKNQHTLNSYSIILEIFKIWKEKKKVHLWTKKDSQAVPLFKKWDLEKTYLLASELTTKLLHC